MKMDKILIGLSLISSVLLSSEHKNVSYEKMVSDYSTVLKDNSMLLDYYNGADKNFLRIADANRKSITNMVHYTSDNSFVMYMEGAGLFIDGGSKESVNLSLSKDFKSKLDDIVSMKVGSGPENIYIVTDPECPFCRRYESSMREIDQLSDKITLNYILFPLESIGHRKSRSMSAYFMMGANSNEQTDRMKDIMIKNDLTGYQSFMLGINRLLKADKAKLSNEEVSLLDKWNNVNNKIKRGEEFINMLGVRGTPTFLDKNLNIIKSQSPKRKVLDSMLKKSASIKDFKSTSVSTVGSMNPEKEYFVFSSITCPHCKEFEKSLNTKFLEKNTVHHFFFGNPEDPTYAWIMSGKDKREIGSRIHAVMSKGKTMKEFVASAEDKKLINDRILNMRTILSKVSVSGTPTVFGPDGKKIDLGVFYRTIK